jgi:NhaA family Na+:H+ antiporter
VARLVARPLQRFLHVEAASGVLLLLATVVALVWANCPWQDSYATFWDTELLVQVGSFEVVKDLHQFVNDGLMAVFFFVVGLEIKRELVVGDLSTARDATLPACAAIGGMVVPALIYAALNVGGDGLDGWGIPMATDIAFAVGVLALLGSRVPQSAKILLLALAIVDDIGAILVIAAVYTETIAFGWLVGALAGLAVVVVLQRARVWYQPMYVVAGFAVWLCTLKSGVHATIAGVALGLLTPARPLLAETQAEQIAHRLSTDDDVDVNDVREVSFAIRESVSVAERVENLLHPWSSYVILPLFALANAGISLSTDGLSDAASSAVSHGVVLGLVLGKPLGVVLAIAVALRLGIARLPGDLTWRHVVGLGALSGIGFTVSLFISGLAFTDPALQQQAALGVLAASMLAAAAGALILGTHRNSNSSD